MKDGCPFCDYDGPSPILREGIALGVWSGTGNPLAFPFFVIEPLEPVTPGHLLVIPREHVEDFRTRPKLLGAMMMMAADVAGKDKTPGSNLIVSAGRVATQTVKHVHVHVVPRWKGDGLALPWASPTFGMA